MAKKAKESVVSAAPIIAPEPSQAPKLDFDAWWALNEKKIPKQHTKDVIWADFKARGLSSQETMQTYNLAIREYGLLS
jgi:hypothetical protein